MKKGFKLLGILFAMTGLLTACGSDDDFTPIIITPTPTITAVAPLTGSSGPPATIVTITGTNFSTTAANNIVKFNGTTAVVTSSTATQIVTTVPVGATTGFITVKRGTKTGSSDPIIFTVTGAPPPPPTAFLMGGSIQGTELTLTTAVGTLAGTGAEGFVNDPTDGLASSFRFPSHITTDGTNLYVADFGNNAIRKIVIATGIVTTFAGTGAAGSLDGPGATATFNGPNGITIDNEGLNLYVTDFTSNLIRKIEIADPQTVSTIAGTATFNGPAGITTDGTNLYVTELFGNVIRQIVIVGEAVTTVAGTATFNGPSGITTDGTNLYVTELFGNLIRQIVIVGEAVTTIADTATFNGPVGITTDGTNLYVTERVGNVIRQIVIDTQVVSTLAGSGATGSANNVNGLLATFNQPYGITTDGVKLFVVDQNNHMIRTIE